MAKKIVLGALLVALIGILVVGAVIGTSTGNVAEAQGRGQGRGAGQEAGYAAQEATQLQDGQTVTLRDELGRPEWAGGGQRPTEQRAATAQGGQGQGRGRGQGGPGQGQGGYGGEDGGVLPGSGGDLSNEEVEALLMALTDEYKAWSVYDQVVADFGAVRPFTNIQKAEENHIAALVTLFDAYGLDVPQNEWPGDVPTFETLAEACEAGVQAEIDNASLYHQLFSMVDNPDIVSVFTALQRASQDQHLPAFERCAP